MLHRAGLAVPLRGNCPARVQLLDQAEGPDIVHLSQDGRCVGIMATVVEVVFCESNARQTRDITNSLTG